MHVDRIVTLCTVNVGVTRQKDKTKCKNFPSREGAKTFASEYQN